MTPSKSNSTEVFVLGRTFYLREIDRGNNLPLYELNLHCMKGKNLYFKTSANRLLVTILQKCILVF